MQHAGWRSRGYLPHYDGSELIQHIVFATVGEGDEISRHFGVHLMRNPEAAEIVESALLHFDSDRYRLLAWCVMPNHVHVVAEQLEGWSLSRIVHSWKSFTANGINRVHDRSGAVWLREYYDRYMRTDEHFAATLAYVEHNPVADKLVSRPEDWLWSSARLRR